MAKAVKSVVSGVTNVVKTVVKAVGSVVKAAVNVVSSVISFVAQPFMGLLGGAPDIPTDAGEADRQQGVLVQVPGGGAVSIPIVYGYRKLGAVTTFAETGSTNNKYLWVVYTFCEGPVAGLREVFLNDEALPAAIVADLNSGRQVDITTGKFAKRVSMLWSPGVYFDSPGASTLGTTLKAGLFKDAPSFKSTMTHNGLACLFVRYEWLAITTQAEADANPFSGSIPVMQVSMLGRGVASLMTSDSENATYGGAGYVERHSYNPAEILLDYLRNPRYGKGLSNSEIDWASWRIAARKFNTEVNYTNNTIGKPGPILTCNYVLDTNNTIFNNVKILLAGCRSYLPYVQGKYKLKVEDAGHPTDILSGAATIVAECTSDPTVRDASLLENQYDIMGDVTYTGIERSNKYNCVVVTYVDPDQKWANQQVVYPVSEADRLYFTNIDGGRENKLEVTFPTITNAAMAYDFARILFNKSRYQETCSVKVSSQAFELEPGDNIRIQSQILDFGSTPWRVVNINYNDDYTFDLSCVRNPDYLYPYTRVGEPDNVLPIYVPKGASIYYPIEQDALPIGLYPPSSPLYNSGYSGTTLYPVLSGTQDPTIGGGAGYANSYINTNTINSTPPGAPQIAPLVDTIDITNIEYITNNGLVYARITVRQPQHVMYEGVNIYYKLNGNTGGYQLLEDRQKPGVGATFTIDIGPMAVVSSLQDIFNSYIAYFRVKYSTGEFSTKFFSLTFNPVTKQGAGTNPSELVQISANSWPTLTIADSNATDNKVDIIRVIVPVPQASTRSATIQFSQDVRTQAVNYNVVGMNIYAKSDAETYWTKTSYSFTNYSPGTEYSFAYSGYLGLLGTGISGSVVTPGGGAIYTFVFRLVYKDGTESSNQYVGTGKVENPGYATGTANLFYGSGVATDTAVPITGHMNINGMTVTQAPAGAAAAALDTKMSVDTTYPSSTSSGIGIVMFAPDSANRATWQGVRIRYRAYSPGTNPAFTTQDFKGATDLAIVSSSYTNSYVLTGAKHDTMYEMVITPLVRANNLNWQESNYSSYGMGYVNRNSSDPLYPQTFTGSGLPNWASSWRWQSMDTGIATNTLNKTFDASTPVASVSACVGKRVALDSALINAKQYKIREYIELTYDCSTISGFNRLEIYRRHRGTVTGSTDLAKYYGIGRWEKINVTNSSGTVSLRLPTRSTEFQPKYQILSGKNLTVGNPTVNYDVISGYPSANATDNATNGESRALIPLLTSFEGVELLLIVRANNVTSTKGLLIKGQILNGSGQVNFAKGVPVDYQSATDTNATYIRDADFLSGYKRLLSEARTTQVSRTDMYVVDSENPTYKAYRLTTVAQPTVWDYTLVDSYPGTGTV